MKSKTSFFNRTLIKSGITRFWPIWVIYTVILVLSVPFSALNGYAPGDCTAAGDSVLRIISTFFLLADFAAACIIAMAVYSYLYTSRSATMTAALPVSRGVMFLSAFVSGLICLILPHLIAAVLSGIVEAAYGIFAMKYLLMWLGMAALRIVFFFGLASLCAVLTGNIITLPIVYLLFSLMFVIAESYICTVLTYFVRGFCCGESTVVSLFSPIVQLLSYDVTTVTSPEGVRRVVYSGWTYSAVCAAVGIVLAACAVLICRKRRMESAGDVVAVKVLKPIFKYCFAFGCTLVLGSVFYDHIFSLLPLPNGVTFAVSAIIGAFIGYSAAQIMIKKSFKVIGTEIKGFVIFAVVIIAAVAMLGFDVFGFERYVPETEDVKTLFVHIGCSDITLTDSDGIEAYGELHRALTEYDPGEETQYDVYLSYVLRNGRTVTRNYPVTFTDKEIADTGSVQHLINSLWNTNEAITARTALSGIEAEDIASAEINYIFISDEDLELIGSETVNLGSEDARSLYFGCVLPDIESGNIGRTYFADKENNLKSYYSVTFGLYKSAARGYDYEEGNYFYYTVPPVTGEAENTFSYLTTLFDHS